MEDYSSGWRGQVATLLGRLIPGAWVRILHLPYKFSIQMRWCRAPAWCWWKSNPPSGAKGSIIDLVLDRKLLSYAKKSETMYVVKESKLQNYINSGRTKKMWYNRVKEKTARTEQAAVTPVWVWKRCRSATLPMFLESKRKQRGRNRQPSRPFGSERDVGAPPYRCFFR